MGIRHRVKRMLERMSGAHILRELPNGVDVFNDLETALEGYEPGVIFDVGANVGQSARVYASRFRDVRIFCFEPVRESFQELQKRIQGDPRVSCHRIAFSDTGGPRYMRADGTKPSNRILCASEVLPESSRVEAVEVSTLDAFCESNQISRVGFLKVDTEGHDLDVLRGAAEMLREHRVDLVEVEVGMNPSNRKHVPFQDMVEHLEQLDYWIFGIYDQLRRGKPILRRTNVVFVSKSMSERHGRLPSVTELPDGEGV